MTGRRAREVPESLNDSWARGREAFSHQEPLATLDDFGLAPRACSRYSYLKKRRETSQARQNSSGGTPEESLIFPCFWALSADKDHDADVPNKVGEEDGAIDGTTFAVRAVSRYQHLRQRNQGSNMTRSASLRCAHRAPAATPRASSVARDAAACHDKGSNRSKFHPMQPSAPRPKGTFVRAQHRAQVLAPTLK